MKPGNAGGVKGCRKVDVQHKRGKRDYEPVTVPFSATPAGEPPSVADWANPSVWTDRMLNTLNQGVRGGKWHTLIDKVLSPRNLFAASRKVIGKKGAAGVDHQTVEDFEEHHREELDRLHEALRTDTYVPQAVRRSWIPKPASNERRPLGVPTVRDRVAQTALLHVLEPIFDGTFSAHSYGFRRGRACHHALEHVEQLLEAGYVHVVDADLKSYFDTIPKDRLMALVREKVSDRRVLRLVEMFLDQGVLEGLKEWTPETGTPQGAVISPLLANIYLNALDRELDRRGLRFCRYADDCNIYVGSEAAAKRVLKGIRVWTGKHLRLKGNEAKSGAGRPWERKFLGFRLNRQGQVEVAPESVERFKQKVREIWCGNRSVTSRQLRDPWRRQVLGWWGYYRLAERRRAIFLLAGIIYFLVYSRHHLVAQAPEEEVALLSREQEKLSG